MNSNFYSILLTVLCIGCSSARPYSRHGIPEQLATELIGLAADRASVKMASEGFDCEIVRNGEFMADVQQLDGTTSAKTVTAIDYVHCTRRDEGGFAEGYVATDWHLALILDEQDAVIHVESRRVLTGL